MDQESSNPRGSKVSSGQYDIVTILGWIGVLALHLSLVQGRPLPSFSPDRIFELLLVWFIFLFPASSCIPMLIRRLRQADGYRFHSWDCWRVVLFVAVYSMLMLMLATIAFEPRWKGSKGMHWAYYLLDGWAGTTLWPIYLVCVVVLIRGVQSASDWMVESPWCLLCSVTLALVSFTYVLAGLFLNFVHGSLELLIVPGSVAICYVLISLIILQNRRFSYGSILSLGTGLWGWLGGLFTLTAIKIPLAWRLYQRLPDDPPSCFIVTAAAQGHPVIVKSRYDPATGTWTNQQLAVFRSFEARLLRDAPSFHAVLRAIYNRVGPVVAICIRNRWMADAVYLLLKPLELLIK